MDLGKTKAIYFVCWQYMQGFGQLLLIPIEYDYVDFDSRTVCFQLFHRFIQSFFLLKQISKDWCFFFFIRYGLFFINNVSDKKIVRDFQKRSLNGGEIHSPASSVIARCNCNSNCRHNSPEMAEKCGKAFLFDAEGDLLSCGAVRWSGSAGPTTDSGGDGDDAGARDAGGVRTVGGRIKKMTQNRTQWVLAHSLCRSSIRSQTLSLSPHCSLSCAHSFEQDHATCSYVHPLLYLSGFRWVG